MDVEETLRSFGYRRDELRTSAAALVVANVLITAAGSYFAFVLVSGMLAWVITFALVIVAVTVWRSLSKAESVA